LYLHSILTPPIAVGAGCVEDNLRDTASLHASDGVENAQELMGEEDENGGAGAQERD